MPEKTGEVKRHGGSLSVRFPPSWNFDEGEKILIQNQGNNILITKKENAKGSKPVLIEKNLWGFFSDVARKFLDKEPLIALHDIINDEIEKHKGWRFDTPITSWWKRNFGSSEPEGYRAG